MENQQQKILITGATGFIGQALCAELAGSDLFVRALVRETSAESILKENSAEIEVVTGNLLEKTSLDSPCANIDTVVHLAGIAHVNGVSSKEYQQTIFSGSRNLIDAAIANRVKKFVFLSSVLAAEVEEGKKDATAYGQAKYDVESYLQAACAETATSYLILRPVNVYGPGMKGNIQSMIRWIKKGILPPLPNVLTKMSLVSVQDLVRLIRLSLHHPNAKNKNYTVSESSPYELLEIESAIYRLLEKKIPTWRSPRMLLYAAAASSGLLARLLGMVGLRSPWRGINLRTYKNLTSDSVYSSEPLSAELGFTPSNNFYDELPSIVEKA